MLQVPLERPLRVFGEREPFRRFSMRTVRCIFVKGALEGVAVRRYSGVLVICRPTSDKRIPLHEPILAMISGRGLAQRCLCGDH